jgi:hypothetical protein
MASWLRWRWHRLRWRGRDVTSPAEGSDCAVCHRGPHRFSTADPEHDFNAVACVNQLLPEIDRLRAQGEPLLGLATTRELLDELHARIEISGLLDYRTVVRVTTDRGRRGVATVNEQCSTCGGEGTVERLATPEEVDGGCELGIAFDPCPQCGDRSGDAEQRDGDVDQSRQAPPA